MPVAAGAAALTIGIAASLAVTRVIGSVLYPRCERFPLGDRDAADLGDGSLPISGVARCPDQPDVRTTAE